MKSRDIGPYLLLGIIIVGFLFAQYSRSPAVRFGLDYDDTLYMSLGKAIAQGEGFVMPSLPGAPPQTKYPILYPLLLSGIWLWIPTLPENLGPAVALTALAACWYLIAAFFLLRRWPGVGRWFAVASVALCAFHPSFLHQGGRLTTEIPFAALMLTSLLCADLGSEEDRSTTWMWLAGVFAGLSFLTRSAGIAVPAGIGLFLLYRRRNKDLLRVVVPAAPCVFGWLLWTLTHRPEFPPDAPRGWVQTWLFNTSYVEFWLLSIPTWRALADMVATNVDSVFMYVSKLTLLHDLGPRSILSRALAFTLSVGILAGIVRDARRHEWRPIHFVFAMKLVIVALWSWTIASRVLVAFLPLLHIGLLTESRNLWGALKKPFRSGGRWYEKGLAGALCIPILWLLATGLSNYARALAPNENRVRLGQALRVDYSELSEWIDRNLPRDTIFIADLDPYLYLTTGHQAILPMAFTDNLYYAPSSQEARAQYAHYMDVARHVQARYWVVDSHVLSSNIPELDELVRAFHEGLPEVFRTSSGWLRILDLTCILEDDRDQCPDLLNRVTPNPPGS